MHITVNIYALLRYYLPAGEKLFREKDWDVPEGFTIGHVVEKLNLPKQVRVTVLLNDSGADQTASLKDGDVVHILPLMGGG